MEKISVVLIGRNDDYGGNLTHRFTHAINHFVEQFDEVIYVDWKSGTKTLFEESIPNLKTKGNLKCYVVTEEDIKKQNPEYTNYSIVEVVARNIGIRRATNDWILVSNIDIICDRFSLDNFKEDILYTSARREVPLDFHIKFNNTQDLVSELKMNKTNFTLQKDSVVNGQAVWDPGDIWSLVVACGDFQFAHRNVWYGIKGFEESLGGRCYADSNLMKKGAINFSIEKALVDLYHLNHGSSKKTNSSEILPMNDRISSVNNFQNSNNDEKWGWSDYELKLQII